MNLFVLLYADDTVIMFDSKDNLQKALNYLYDIAVNISLKLIQKKTKVIVIVWLWFIFHNVHINKQRQQKSALYKVVGEVA